jgi:hypothetical protein
MHSEQLNHSLACRKTVWQSLSLIFLVATGCTTLPPAEQSGRLPDGLYQFEAGKAVPKQMCEVTWTPQGWQVVLHGETGGSFVLRPDAEGRLDITSDEMDYPGLKRSLSGSGTLTATGSASGSLELWHGNMGPLNRNHREAEWFLIQATPDQAKRFRDRQLRLEERRKRAREAGLEL